MSAVFYDLVGQIVKASVNKFTRSGHVAGISGVVVSLRFDQDAVRTTLAQHQQAVIYSVFVPAHEAGVLSNEGHIPEGGRLEILVFVFGKFDDFFYYAVRRGVIASLPCKNCLHIQHDFHSPVL